MSYENLYTLPLEIGARIHAISRDVALAMKQAYGCAGTSTRQHNEPAGHQEVWHYHLHVFPRYPADDLYLTRKSRIGVAERAACAVRRAPPRCPTLRGMIKLVYCIRKRADVSGAEFHRYWLEEHGPRVRGHAKALGADRYVQSHTLDSEVNEGLRASREMSPPHDGITELWWSDMEAFRKALATADGIAAGKDLLEDERHFIDFENSTLFLTEEHKIF